MNPSNGSDADASAREYPEHLAEAAQAIDELRAQRVKQLPPSERAVQRILDAIARPAFIVGLACCIGLWLAINAAMRAVGRPFDDSAYSLLNLIATLVSLVLVLAVLSGQRTTNVLEQERARLMLQLMLIHDRKVTQTLNAVEDLRRANPRAADPELGELHEETDLHAAARALQEAESQEGD